MQIMEIPLTLECQFFTRETYGSIFEALKLILANYVYFLLTGPLIVGCTFDRNNLKWKF